MKTITPDEISVVLTRFWEKVEVRGDSECWPWIGSLDKDGYGIFWITPTNKTSAHRAAMVIETNLPLTSAEHVLHDCDYPRCVNARHLGIGDNKQNIEDKVRKGRQAFGERHGCAKLTEAQVREIKRLLAAGIPQRLIAKQFNISKSIVAEISTGGIWSHVTL